MTRINLVPPAELYDQHLIAEWREIKMIPRALQRSLQTRAPHDVLKAIPQAFTLGTGHVTFFYDKGCYLFDRYDQLTEELQRRGFRLNPDAELDPLEVYQHLDLRFFRNYRPTAEALRIIRQRLAEKIAMKPSWYRMSSSP